MGSDNEIERSQKEKQNMLALAPIAKPLAGKKLGKKTVKLARKASGPKCLKREVKKGGNIIRRGNKGTTSEEDIDRSPLWKYVTRLAKAPGGGNVCFTCNYCQNTFKGSYSRVKAHLLKISGSGIRVCAKVTSENLSEMRRLVDETDSMVEASLPQHVQLPPSYSRICSSSASYASASMGRIGCEAFQIQPKKRKVTGESAIEKAINPEAWEELDSLIARMFYSAGLPFHLARNPYYVAAFTEATVDSRTLAGYVPPGYDMLRTTLLQKERANIERLLEPIKNTWKEKGVSIICDGWIDAQRRPIINFIAACESGSMFLKAVNNEGDYKNEFVIASLTTDSIYEIGPANVVQVITDNAPVCRSAGLLIEAQFPHVFWTPSVAHTLDLVLRIICTAKETEGNVKTFTELDWVKETIDDVMMIKDFIMDHSMILSIFNEYAMLKLLSIAETRFASSIVMLKRFKKMKQGLQSIVISNCWSSYKEEDVRTATFVREKLLDDVWWNKIDYILSFTEPIYEMLRLVDTDMPCLHLVYDMWDCMIKKVKGAIYRHESKREDEKSTFYLVVHQILVDQWGMSNTPLHCLAHSLNPKYYSAEWLEQYPDRVPPYKHEKISRGRLRCFERYFGDVDELRQANTEFAQFAAGLMEFANFNSLNDRGGMEPGVWWMTYGSSTPLLQKLAMKLLGQPCSSSCCESNWSTYSYIKYLKKNKITPQKGEDLVFVHSNLRLLSRRTPQYKQGETKMWDVGGDAFDTMEGSGILEIANLSLDEPDLETVIIQ